MGESRQDSLATPGCHHHFFVLDELFIEKVKVNLEVLPLTDSAVVNMDNFFIPNLHQHLGVLGVCSRQSPAPVEEDLPLWANGELIVHQHPKSLESLIRGQFTVPPHFGGSPEHEGPSISTLTLLWLRALLLELGPAVESAAATTRHFY